MLARHVSWVASFSPDFLAFWIIVTLELPRRINSCQHLGWAGPLAGVGICSYRGHFWHDLVYDGHEEKGSSRQPQLLTSECGGLVADPAYMANLSFEYIKE